jgi:hypothetical protein
MTLWRCFFSGWAMALGPVSSLPPSAHLQPHHLVPSAVVQHALQTRLQHQTAMGPVARVTTSIRNCQSSC